MSPTQRTLAFLRKQGYTAAITERWNQFAHICRALWVSGHIPRQVSST